MNFNTSLYSNAVGGIAEEFGVSDQSARLGAAIFLITYAFGCELWAPWSEELIPVGIAPNFATILVCLPLGGLSTAGGSVTLGMVADMWEADTQQYAVAFIVFSSLGGSVLGPIVGGFVEEFLAWRWNIWIQLIFRGAVQTLHFFLVPETRTTIMMDRIAKKRRAEGEKNGKPVNIWGPNELTPFKERFSAQEILITWIRPFRTFLTEPIVLVLSLLSGFSDALISIFLQSYALVYKQWDFATFAIGLAFIPIGIGYFLAWFSFIPAIKRNIKVRRERPHDEIAKYKSRLWWLLDTAPSLPVGLIGHRHRNYAIYMATIDYMIYAYGPYSASATGGNGWSRDFLAGVLTLGRHALGGRNWEGFATDPYLAGKAMQATIHGIQSVGVQACSKHFIGNEQETYRSNRFLKNGTEIMAISSNIDDRTLHELYLWPFADAIRAGTASIMCSYNRVNQTYACEDKRMLDEILRAELGFQGYVVSDWFATHSGAKSINAGLDLNMPGALNLDALQSDNDLSYWGIANVTRMINEGTVSEERIDEMIKRILLPYFYLGQDQNYPNRDPAMIFATAAHQGIPLDTIPFPMVPTRDVRGDHYALIRRMGAEGVVLLKNVNNTLPLKSPASIGVFGNDAPPPINGVVFVDKRPFEIGTVGIGGGSGTGRPTYLVSPFEAVMAKAKEFNARVQYVTNNSVLAENDFRSIYPIPDVCLVFLNTFAAEGWDRTSYEPDWNSTLVVEHVARMCPNTVVATHSSGVNTFPWAHNPNVRAILAAHYPGQESGNSIVDVLWGDVNPSAKLPYTIPANQSDYDIPIVDLTEAEVTSPGAWQSNFSEGQFIDYRHFDKFNVTPLYEFGFGLSYTSFEFAGSLEVESLASYVSAAPNPNAEILPGGNADLWKRILRIKTRVTNSGGVAGATVPQLYLSSPQNTTPIGAPVQVLRGFDKVLLQPGESKQVVFELMRRDLSYWDVETQTWLIPAGTFTFRVGFSSRDIRHTTTYSVIH